MLNQTQLKEVEKLFDLGAHLGHKKSRLHPKARKNVYQIINGTSVIDLTTTVNQLQTAKQYLKEASKQNLTALVVGTKKTASSFIKEYCATHNVPFIASKWLPGLLTNFKTIMKNVQKLKDFAESKKTGELENMVKHERIKLEKDMTKLERLYGGLITVSQRPDILIIVDVRKEKNAVKEAQMYNIPIVAMVDTNANPEEIDYPIVANDDDAEVVEYIMTDLLASYQPVGEEKPAADKEEKKAKTATK